MKSLLLKFNLFFFFFISLNSFSQSKKLWIEAGDKSFNQQDYSTAIAWYLKVLDDTTVLKNSSVLPYETQMVNQKIKRDSTKTAVKDSTKKVVKDTSAIGFKGAKKAKGLKVTAPLDYTLLQLSHAYRLNSDDQNALTNYKKCVDAKLPDARYYYAITLMNVRKYQDALNEFELYINSGNANDSLSLIAQKKEGGCYLGMDSLNVAREIKVNQFDTTVFNKGNSSFAPTYFLNPDKIVFTSARKGGTILDPKKEESEYLCDLYWSEFKDTAWTAPLNFGTPVNSSFHEGAAFVNEKAIYFTRWNDANVKETAIYKANNQNERFFLPQKLNQNVNLTGYKSMHPFVSADGKKLFYSSNRPGGKGGLDIWVCSIDESGMISEPKNLGSPVNTAGDEVTPFLHSLSSQLYFSSNGLTGLGGLDIFKTEYNPDDGVFGLPINVGKPINSSKDDSYYIMERNGLSGLFSSDRAECPGGNCYKIYGFRSEPVKFDVSGVAFDSKTNLPMSGALITIRNVHNEDETQYIPTDDKGNYFAELRAGGEYFMKAQKNKYLGDAASVVTKDKVVTTHFENTDFFLTPIPEGEIEIEGIEYDFNSANLRPVSMASLDKIADLLILNDNLSVDIEANTDSRGNDDYNMKLSKARAQSCVDYLISKGIAINRLLSKGNGETKPLITEVEIKKLKAKSPEWEAAHQKNRRTALRITGESQINIINKGK